MSSRIDIPHLDLADFIQRLKNVREQILKDAAIAYVEGASGHIRVDTGMSRGTLDPLASFLGITVYNPGVAKGNKSQAQGAAQAQQSNFITSSGNTSTFEWSADVLQYNLNEEHPLPSNAGVPWRSRNKGTMHALEVLARSGSEIAKGLKVSISTSTRSI